MKNHIKIYLLLLFVNSFLTCAIAQTPSTIIRELKIGDQCPDFEFTKLVNTTQGHARLSDFKGKLVILDFWATWCGPCIAAFPKLDSLQRAYQDKIMIIPITSEKTETASNFFKVSTLTKGNKLFSVTKDTTLRKYFPHTAIPHEIWIDGNGKVIAITRGIEVNGKNIDSYLQNKQLKLSVKKELDINPDKPILNGGFGVDYQFNDNKIKYQSILIDHIPGSYSSVSKVAIMDSTIHVRALNMPIEALYINAFMAKTVWKSDNPDFYLEQPARTILQVRDSSIFYYWPGKTRVAMDNAFNKSAKMFCYEIYAPKPDSTQINKYMVDDMNKYFGRMYHIEGIRKKRRVRCWSLQRITKQDLIKSKGGKPYIFIGINRDTLSMINMPLKELMFALATDYMYSNPIPIIDESGYLGNVDLTFKAALKNPKTMGKALEEYGLAFKLVKRRLDMIIIREAKNR